MANLQNHPRPLGCGNGPIRLANRQRQRLVDEYVPARIRRGHHQVRVGGVWRRDEDTVEIRSKEVLQGVEGLTTPLAGELLSRLRAPCETGNDFGRAA